MHSKIYTVSSHEFVHYFCNMTYYPCLILSFYRFMASGNTVLENCLFSLIMSMIIKSALCSCFSRHANFLLKDRLSCPLVSEDRKRQPI